MDHLGDWPSYGSLIFLAVAIVGTAIYNRRHGR